MCLAFRLSQALGYCKPGDGERVAAHFAQVGLPTRIGDVPGARPDVPDLLRLMGQDKKVRQGKLTFILARAIGEAFICHDVPPQRLRDFLAGEIAANRSR
jgi:3-dehydroquinate synthetase